MVDIRLTPYECKTVRLYMKNFTSFLVALALAVLGAVHVAYAVAPASQGAQGVWSDEDGKANIKIEPCGRYLCGHIVWLSEPVDESGQPKVDVKNPEPSRRNQPLMGLTILSKLEPYEGDRQLKGLVYNAEDGKVYDVYLAPKGSTMNVEGCFAMFLCGSQTWTRVK
jgi:uncharacterized protein (DUF2147 family)